MPSRLLALDLDGTLLGADGTIDPRDAAAIRAARRAGVVVTLATGRLATGALSTARALDLDAPLICADGGLLACARSGAPLEQRALPLAIAEDVLRALAARALAPFVLLHDAIHCDEPGRAHAGRLAAWSPDLVAHPSLLGAAAWRRDGAIALLLGIGARPHALAARDELARALGDRLDLADFDVSAGGPFWALRAQPPGCSKGDALARLASRAGIPRASVAAVGDWYNDVSMLAWAGRSFAMGHAPAPVREAATDTLAATGGGSGGVAEAIARWLGTAVG